MATIKDIAELAKVGTTTVSRVLNNSQNVSEKTRLKVNEAIKKLDYTPNEYARLLKSNETKIIAVSVPSIWHPFFSEFVFYIEKKLKILDYRLFISSNNNNPAEELKFLDMVKQNKVDGIIALTYQDIESYLISNIPFVSIDRYFRENVAYVTSDNYMGGRLAAEKLIESGVNNPAYLASIAKQKNDTLKRQNGFKDKLIELDINPISYTKKEPILDYENFFDSFFCKYPNVDGIFAMNDEFALRLIKYLEEKRISVPNDIQIIGYDGVHYFENYSVPITSIKQPIADMAEAALDLLFKQINHEPVNSPIVLPVKFQKGYTTVDCL